MVSSIPQLMPLYWIISSGVLSVVFIVLVMLYDEFWCKESSVEMSSGGMLISWCW